MTTIPTSMTKAIRVRMEIVFPEITRLAVTPISANGRVIIIVTGWMMDSRIADLKNVGNRTGGSITAGAFLQEFVGDTPWAHLDIAGTAWDYTEKSYIAKGPSAAGVRPLLEMIHAWR